MSSHIGIVSNIRVVEVCDPLLVARSVGLHRVDGCERSHRKMGGFVTSAAMGLGGRGERRIVPKVVRCLKL